MNIENHNSDKILTGSNYNDFINNYVGPVTINGLDGNDNIRNIFATTRRNDYVLINSGTGNDLISNDGKYATVNGDEDNDLIFNLSNDSTISGGTGDDSIANNVWEDRFYDGHIDYLGSSSGNNILFQYAEGDGNDIIYGFKDNSTLSITGSSYFTTKSGNDIIVTVGEDEITLSGAAGLSKPNIVGKVLNGVRVEGNYENYSSYKDALIVGNDSNNLIYNRAKNVRILTNGGNDTVTNANKNVSIACGEGNDFVHSYDSTVTIDGGSGNDTLETYSGQNVTISGEAGNDSIVNYQKEA